jgi:hypothetical protein
MVEMKTRRVVLLTNDGGETFWKVEGKGPLTWFYWPLFMGLFKLHGFRQISPDELDEDEV